MSLSSTFLDELRSRTLLSTLIGRTTKLQKAGREFRACCPFHNEKSPSFYVNDDKGFYHCFGCSAHGDAIRWLTDQRGLPFMDAVKELAQAAGMELPAMDPRAQEKAEVAKGLHEACADAASWFTDQLNGLAGAEARGVLEKRGIRPDTAKAFALGYAPDSRGKLKDALKEYGAPLLIEAGLLISVEDKTPYDRFRGRLMIPIRDPRGRTVAFGGRIIGDGEPKYLNSPETPLFDKGRTLYNLDKAAPAARKTGRVLVVEGYMDVIALAQAGFEEAVAPLGTALTETQLERLWRMSEVPILCLDGDSAGQKAAIRAAHRALPLLAPGRSLAFVTLPQGQDPDDLVQSQGAQAFETLLAGAVPLVEQLWASEIKGQSFSTPEERAALGQRLRALASTIQDEHLRKEYLATFNRMVWDYFHPDKPSSSFKKFKHPLNRGILSDRVRAIASHGIDQVTFIPAALRGLITYTDLIAPTAETLARIPIRAPKLRQTLEHMLSAALSLRSVVGDADHLETSELRTILVQDGLSDVLARLDAVTLAFSFVDPQGEPEKARQELASVIDALATKPALEADIGEAQANREFWTAEDFEKFAHLMRTQHEMNQVFQDALMRNEDDALAE